MAICTMKGIPTLVSRSIRSNPMFLSLSIIVGEGGSVWFRQLLSPPMAYERILACELSLLTARTDRQHFVATSLRCNACKARLLLGPSTHDEDFWLAVEGSDLKDRGETLGCKRRCGGRRSSTLRRLQLPYDQLPCRTLFYAHETVAPPPLELAETLLREDRELRPLTFA